MKKIETLKLMLAISLVLILSGASLITTFFVTAQPYINENNVTYHLNENSQVTSVEITISNPTLSNVSQDLILRYCREDRYPEGYSSPIIFSLKPLETKTFTITNFRNTWYYNETYHIESDRIDVEDKGILVASTTPDLAIFIISMILLPVGVVGLITSIVLVVKNRKNNSKTQQHIVE